MKQVQTQRRPVILKQFLMAHLKPGKKEVNRTESFLKDIQDSFRYYKLDNSIGVLTSVLSVHRGIYTKCNQHIECKRLVSCDTLFYVLFVR